MQRTEEQAELATILRTLLDKRSGSAAVREAAGSAVGHDEELWRTLCEGIGAAALDVPEEYDGAGASLAESLVVLEELGRALTPSPLLASVIAVEAVLHCDDEDAKARLLPRIAAGEIATVAFAPTNVLYGTQATIVLAVEGDELVEVDPSVARTPTPALDITLQLAELDLGSASTKRIGGHEAVRRGRDTALVGTAALQLGGMQRALDDTVAYTRQRVQFGRAIGSFQALKHRMADMLVRVEMSRSAVLAAATHQTSEAALAAASYCSESFLHVAAEMVQLHGGIAITWEHDAHLVLKRAHALGALWGRPHEHRALVAL
jgi:alkylation response protein AidB-like acyl-CoA dehydrogenase